ncbi:MAG TPA: hypothetical protein VJU61_12710 [Polyangiaceae bacterium]|nr:hypothetical protein [Polyangiaceae bacterium]
MGTAANTPGSSSSGRANNAGTPGSANSGPAVVIDGFGRAPGMAIGQGPGDDEGDDGETTPPLPLDPAASDPDDVEIPVFETPPEVLIPCTGCVELSAVIDDINQRSDFTFNAGGVAITGVTWTLLIPFNSDQLFIRSFVNGTDGAYTPIPANSFAINTPVQFVQQINTTATTVGFALGSAGAWTGDQRISVFIDAVTLTGAPAASKTFDTDAGGITPRTTERSPSVVFHP